MQYPPAEKIAVHGSGRAMLVRGQWVPLGPKQGIILQILLQTPGQVVRKETIADRVWGRPVTSSLIAVHIHYLRKKLELDADRPKILLTLPGVGFVLSTGAADFDVSSG